MQDERNIPYGYCHCGCGERTRLAKKNRPKQQHVKGQPVRYISGHNKRKQHGSLYESRDLGYDTPCWIWRGYVYRDDYARIKRNGRSQPAHRYMYEQYVGEIGEGLVIDHLCMNKPCVNPDHLEPVTTAENNRRAAIWYALRKATPHELRQALKDVEERAAEDG